jgi:penicillin G amidase
MIRKLLIWSIGGVLVLLLVASTTVYFFLRASLPLDSGELTVTGVGAEVSIVRDERGIPTIAGESLEDVAFGLGFVHAQERFFQMDLIRRQTAGELAALVGPRGLPSDRVQRPKRYRAVAERALAELPARHRLLLERYADGVNTGIGKLRSRHPEYWLLNVPPEPWLPEDALLVQLQHFDLLNAGLREEALANTMRAYLPEALVEFLLARQSRFDVLVLSPTTSDYQPMPIPEPDVIDLRSAPIAAINHDLAVLTNEPMAASNAWAVGADRSIHGHAILASDPHLPLSLPNYFFQVHLVWPGGQAVGASVPGSWWIGFGATDQLAWGFTNGRGDLVDYVVVEIDPDRPERYLGPDGWEAFDIIEEEIAVRGQPANIIRIQSTRWGPVVSTDHLERPLAMRSRIHEPGGLNVAPFDFFHAPDVETAVELVRDWHGPSWGTLLADSSGQVGFVLSGQFPLREGFDGRWSVSWADGQVGWRGLLDEELRPVRIDPPEGAVFHANNRPVTAAWAHQIGSRWSSTRAHRVAELLSGQATFDEHSMLAMQLDTQVALHEIYRELVLELVDANEIRPHLRLAREQAHGWNGRADADQVGFRILEAYQLAIMEALLRPVLVPVLEADPGFRLNWGLVIEPILRIVEERPEHWLPPGHEEWSSFLRTTLEQTVTELDRDTATPPAEATWGEVNRMGLRHPIAGRLPVIGDWFNIDPQPMPGHTHAVRAQSLNYGAALRLVASPGRLDEGLFHMPGGQSGHFLSPHYRSAHPDWVNGRAQSLLPGSRAHELRLIPADDKKSRRTRDTHNSRTDLEQPRLAGYQDPFES